MRNNSIAQQQHELGLGKAAPLRYAAFPSRLCRALYVNHMKKIFVIEDKFEIVGKGIVLVGITEDDSIELENGDIALIKQSEYADLNVEVLGFQLLRNCWSQHKPKNMSILVPLSIGIDSIQLKSEVWANV